MILAKEAAEDEEDQIGPPLLHEYILNLANAIYQEISPLCVAEFREHISDHKKRLQVANNIEDESDRNIQLSKIYKNEWHTANLMHAMHADSHQFPNVPQDAGGNAGPNAMVVP